MGWIVSVIAFLVLASPITWLLMLFLGNVGINIGFLGTLPLATVVLLTVILNKTAVRDS